MPRALLNVISCELKQGNITMIIIINMIRLIIIHNINTVQRRGHWTSMGVECNHHGVFYLVLTRYIRFYLNRYKGGCVGPIMDQS